MLLLCLLRIYSFIDILLFHFLTSSHSLLSVCVANPDRHLLQAASKVTDGKRQHAKRERGRIESSVMNSGR